MKKVGDGGTFVRHLWDEQMNIAKERRRAVAAKARAGRGAHKRTKQQRQAERDEIAEYLARVPEREY